MKDASSARFSRRTVMRWLGAVSLPFLAIENGTARADEMHSLAGVIGITTGGALESLRKVGGVDLPSLPTYVRDRLGMELIDVNTRWTESRSKSELLEIRKRAESLGCYFSNLKVNHAFGDLYSPNTAEKNKALDAGKQLIGVAKSLGTRWIRFTVPERNANDPYSHRELAKHAKDQGIQLLVENSGWMFGHANAIAQIVSAIGDNVASCPDTGNWDTNALRSEGLRSSFPGAASCDFKVFELDEKRNHARYDLKDCFDIGWNAGFRGPWVIEFIKEDPTGIEEEIVFVRDMLLSWIAEKNKNS
jgi:hypothetical protein